MREKENYRVSSNLDGYFCTGPACVAASCSICGAEVPSSVLGWGLEGTCPPVGGPFAANAATPGLWAPWSPGSSSHPSHQSQVLLGRHVCPTPSWGQNLTPLRFDYFTYRSVACGVQTWVSFEKNSN